MAAGSYYQSLTGNPTLEPGWSEETKNTMSTYTPLAAQQQPPQPAAPAEKPAASTVLATPPATGESSTFGKDIVSKDSVAKVGAGIGASISAADQLHQDQFYTDTEKWRALGKYWFDPNQNLKPDINAYIAKMPSQVESLRSESFGSVPKGGSNAKDVGYSIMNPGAIKFTGGSTSAKVASDIANPLNLLDLAAGEGFAGYISSKAAKQIMSGDVKFGIGIAIAVIEGVFSWFGAKDADKKARQQAYDEYDQEVKKWEQAQFDRNKAIKEATGKASQARMEQKIEQAKSDEEKKKAQVDLAIERSREQMKNALLNAGTARKQAIEDRIKRWR